MKNNSATKKASACWKITKPELRKTIGTDTPIRPFGEVNVRIPQDRNGEYELQIIGEYSRNAD